ncbi:MAG TPA: sigma-70 region 4 domain-containing protein [Terracidiphilus sp.]|nr:sigma-70 region 4 domain-containing protein [Terracidiphilus sp.]
MSAALLLSTIHGAATSPSRWFAAPAGSPPDPSQLLELEAAPGRTAPVYSLAFYRKHTEKMLRRYLYASMHVGRCPSILNEPLGRGMVSSRPVRSFEDAVIFVLDVESCLAQLRPLDRQILAKAVLQEYEHDEVALMLGIADRTMEVRLGQALDRLTRIMLDLGLLLLP